MGIQKIPSVQALVMNHIENTYRKVAIAEVLGEPCDAYPKRFRIASVPTRVAQTMTSELRDYAAEIDAFAKEFGLDVKTCELHLPARLVLPTHLTIPDRFAADEIARQTRHETATKTDAFVAKLTMVRDEFGKDGIRRIQDQAWKLDRQPDTDAELVVRAAAYIRDNPPEDGLTPRQVPLPGFSAKWLDKTRLSLICALAEHDVTVNKRPRRLEFAYLDPVYAEGDGRHVDLWVEGDPCPPQYAPKVLIVVENIDNMLFWPQDVPGAICVFGHGRAVCDMLPRIPWATSCDTIWYWGDMDEDGYRILDALRARLPQTRSLNMGEDCYRAYAKFGTNLTPDGRTLQKKARANCAEILESLENLTDDEKAALRRCLTYGPVRRIEQERVAFPEIKLE